MSGAGPLLAIAVAEAAEVQGETASDGDGEQPGLSHWFCCLEDRGICGTKLDGDFDDDDSEPAECVVCRAMEDQPCEVTCEPWLGQAG